MRYPLFILTSVVVLSAGALPTHAQWNLTGNAGTTPGTNFVGTTDNKNLVLKANNTTGLRIFPGGPPSVVGGSYKNSVTSGVKGAAIGGGGSEISPHQITDDYGTIGGGVQNQAGDGAGTVADAAYATVSGGFGNDATAYAATVGGGYGNSALQSDASVAGGSFNLADGTGAGVAGGLFNDAVDDYAAVGGGYGNLASGYLSTIAGGYFGEATGSYSAILGGYFNEATSTGSVALGWRAKAVNAGAFVWSDQSAGDFSSTAAHQFRARASGGVTFFTNSAATVGATLAPGSGSWAVVSDRALKGNFTPVDGVQVLEKLAALPIGTWNYTSQDPAVRHIGPTAQDFRAAFAVGEDERHISTVDADGVALAAIQGLHRLLAAKDAQIQHQQQQLAALQRRLEAIEYVVQTPQSPSYRAAAHTQSASR
ncbi:tail fiber domain-containing protein [Gloeobacter violaceus]|uniref:Gll0250 protein n=1 Tax=Gloeobacter violaceus (strain ATCC 29082 / PCC 7421) TaxID=251221 RepID=Q7NP08_GLOVI|nr:tail fiber domain-containing protein [Gloeobacter violaceus]BAC88191.1 gll0250 [Gloeobacter violaceus PCC 7421]